MLYLLKAHCIILLFCVLVLIYTTDCTSRRLHGYNFWALFPFKRKLLEVGPWHYGGSGPLTIWDYTMVEVGPWQYETILWWKWAPDNMRLYYGGSGPLTIWDYTMVEVTFTFLDINIFNYFKCQMYHFQWRYMKHKFIVTKRYWVLQNGCHCYTPDVQLWLSVGGEKIYLFAKEYIV